MEKKKKIFKCEIHKLPSEFICSCSEIICKNCIDNHKNHEGFTVRNLTDVKNLFYDELNEIQKILKDLDSPIQEINYLVNEWNSELLKNFLCISEGDEKIRKILTHQINQFNENRGIEIEEDEMSQFLTKNYKEKLLIIERNQINKISEFTKILNQEKEKLKNEYMILLNKYFKIGTGCEKGITTNNKEEFTSKSKNLSQNLYTNDDNKKICSNLFAKKEEEEKFIFSTNYKPDKTEKSEKFEKSTHVPVNNLQPINDFQKSNLNEINSNLTNLQEMGNKNVIGGKKLVESVFSITEESDNSKFDNKNDIKNDIKNNLSNIFNELYISSEPQEHGVIKNLLKQREYEKKNLIADDNIEVNAYSNINLNQKLKVNRINPSNNYIGSFDKNFSANNSQNSYKNKIEKCCIDCRDKYFVDPNENYKVRCMPCWKKNKKN